MCVDNAKIIMPFQNVVSIAVLLSMEPWAAAEKALKLVWRCHQLLSGFLAKDHIFLLLLSLVVRWVDHGRPLTNKEFFLVHLLDK